MSWPNSDKENRRDAKNLRFLIVGCFVIVTVGLAAVLWSFISSLQENSEKMTSYKAGNAWFGAKVQMPEAIDKSFLPTSAEQSAFKKSGEIYDDAEELAMRGEYRQAISTGKAALKQLEKEIEAQKSAGAQPDSNDSPDSPDSNGSNGSNHASSSAASPDSSSSKSTDGLSLGSFETRTGDADKKSGSKPGDALDSADSAKSMEAKMIDTIASYADKAGDGKKVGDDSSNETALGGVSTATKAKGEVIHDKSSPLDKIRSGRHAFLGKMYFRVGEFQNSVDEYTQALKLTPTSPPLFTSRADAYTALGDKEAAKKDAAQAYYLNQHEDGRQRAIERVLGQGASE